MQYRGYEIVTDEGQTFVDTQDGTGLLTEVRDTEAAQRYIDGFLAPCDHETVWTPDGHGAYCKHCGDCLA